MVLFCGFIFTKMFHIPQQQHKYKCSLLCACFIRIFINQSIQQTFNFTIVILSILYQMQTNSIIHFIFLVIIIITTTIV